MLLGSPSARTASDQRQNREQNSGKAAKLGFLLCPKKRRRGNGSRVFANANQRESITSLSFALQSGLTENHNIIRRGRRRCNDLGDAAGPTLKRRPRLPPPPRS